MVSCLLVNLLHTVLFLSQDHMYCLIHVTLTDLYPPLLGHPVALPPTLVVSQFLSVYPILEISSKKHLRAMWHSVLVYLGASPGSKHWLIAVKSGDGTQNGPC